MKIEIKDLTKHYQNKKVLDVEQLTIKKGIITGIIGPNGAGKSTLIKILAALEASDKGIIKYEDEPLEEKHLRKMTLVFQKPYLLRTSVYKNIAYPLILRKESKQAVLEKVEALLKELQLDKIKAQNARKLSGGEAQKVALARALVFKPDLLFLDEPTANIDPSTMALMEQAIRKINEENKTTVLVVTHNIQQAKRLCHEIIFMNEGKVAEMGEAHQMIYAPENEQTRKFISGEMIIIDSTQNTKA